MLLWQCLVFCGFCILACLSNTSLNLNELTCKQRYAYSVKETGIYIIWNGTRIETSCSVVLRRDASSSDEMCIFILKFNISKQSCAPNIQLAYAGYHKQLVDCQTENPQPITCIVSESLTLRVEANASASVVALMVSTNASLNSYRRRDMPNYVAPAKIGLSLAAIIGIICGVFIPIIIIAIVIAFICIRRTEKQLRQLNEEEVERNTMIEDTNNSPSNGGIETTDLSQPAPLKRLTVTDDDDDVLDQSNVRLSANV